MGLMTGLLRDTAPPMMGFHDNDAERMTRKQEERSQPKVDVDDFASHVGVVLCQQLLDAINVTCRGCRRRSTGMKLYLLTALTLIQNVSSFITPKRGISCIKTLRNNNALTLAKLSNDEDNDLDDEWRQFQEERTANQQISLSDFAQDDLFNPDQESKADDSNTVASVGLFFLVAIVCLLAIFFNGEKPVLIDDSFMNLEDVDSAQGRFHALTGGVWL